MSSNKSRGKFREAFTKEKIMRFLDKQGFYIVLFVCIAIIGITAYMTSEKPEQPQQEIVENQQATEESKEQELAQTDLEDTQQEPEKDKIDIKIKDSEEQPDKANETESTQEAEDEKAQETLASNTPKKEEETKKGETSGKQNQAQSSKASSSKITMVYPVQGNILKEHTTDELVYSQTLKEWRTHSGIDIEASTGTEVKAALGGTVEEITEDPLMGICITLDHGNGLKTFYANLSTGNMVTVGQKVDKGQIISGVGSTASAEILDGPHLHFEVLLNGESVDPKQYLK